MNISDSMINEMAYKLLQIISRGYDSEIVLFDAHTQTYSLRSYFGHNMIKLLRSSVVGFANILQTSVFNTFLDLLDYRINMTTLAQEHFNKIKIIDHGCVKNILNNQEKYTVKEFKNFIIKIKTSDLAKKIDKKSLLFAKAIRNNVIISQPDQRIIICNPHQNKRSITQDNISQTAKLKTTEANKTTKKISKNVAVKQVKANKVTKNNSKKKSPKYNKQTLDSTKITSNKIISNIRKHVNFIVSNEDFVQTKKKDEAIVFFDMQDLAINASKKLKQIFKNAVAKRVDYLKQKRILNVDRLIFFRNYSIFPLVLEVCIEKQINISEYFDIMPYEDMYCWEDLLSLQKIYNLIKDNAEFNVNRFEELLNAAIKSDDQDSATANLNLIYSGMIKPETLLAIDMKYISKLLKNIVAKYKDKGGQHINYLLNLYSNATDYGYKDEALTLAIFDNLKKCTQALMKTAFNADAAASGTSILTLAMQRNNTTLVKKLLASGASVDLADTTYGFTPLIYAIKNHKTKYISNLITKSKDVNIKTVSGKTAIWYALYQDTISETSSIIQKLYKKGADVNIKYAKGDTLLIYAVFLENVEVVKQLIKMKADVNSQNDLGDTALMVAVRKNNVSIIEQLLASGAKTGLKNTSDETAETIALSSSSSDIRGFFVKE